MAQTITLITGANKGLGYETARRLVAAGHTVLAAARDPERGERAAADLGATFVPLDVTDDASVAAAAAWVGEQYGRLDVLVNNAGVVGPPEPLAGIDVVDAQATFDTNVFGVIRVTQAFLSLLRQSEQPRIVNVSSGTGRLTWQVENDFPDHAPAVYSASKAAVTMLTLRYAKSLPGIHVNAAGRATRRPTSTNSPAPRRSSRVPSRSWRWRACHRTARPAPCAG